MGAQKPAVTKHHFLDAVAHVFDDEAAEATHGLRDALLMGRNDLAEVFREPTCMTPTSPFGCRLEHLLIVGGGALKDQMRTSVHLWSFRSTTPNTPLKACSTGSASNSCGRLLELFVVESIPEVALSPRRP